MGQNICEQIMASIKWFHNHITHMNFHSNANVHPSRDVNDANTIDTISSLQSSHRMLTKNKSHRISLRNISENPINSNYLHLNQKTTGGRGVLRSYRWSAKASPDVPAAYLHNGINMPRWQQWTGFQ